MQHAKDNVEEITREMAAWSRTPLFERREGKNETLLQLEDRDERLKRRYDEVAAAGARVHALLQVSGEKERAHTLVYSHAHITTLRGGMT